MNMNDNPTLEQLARPVRQATTVRDITCSG